MKIILLGAHGQLGKELGRQLAKIGNIFAFSRSELDITNYQSLRNVVCETLPDLIVNAAAYSAVDQAETDPTQANDVNAKALKNIAKIAKEQNIWLIHYSTEYVFDGKKSKPYLETDKANPLNVYGASKLAGEQAIEKINCRHLIFRISGLIGKDGNNFAKSILKLAIEREKIYVASDQVGVPTSALLVSKVTVDAIQAIKSGNKWEQGIYHLAPHGISSWYEVAQTLLKHAEFRNVLIRAKASDVEPILSSEYPAVAVRPVNSLLETRKLRGKLSFVLPHWKDDFISVATEIIEELG